jgi:hypothetical protein
MSREGRRGVHTTRFSGALFVPLLDARVCARLYHRFRWCNSVQIGSHFVSAEEDIRRSLMRMLENLNTISKARCFSGKNIRFSYGVGSAVPLADLADFVEQKSADLAQQIARI